MREREILYTRIHLENEQKTSRFISVTMKINKIIRKFFFFTLSRLSHRCALYSFLRSIFFYSVYFFHSRIVNFDLRFGAEGEGIFFAHYVIYGTRLSSRQCEHLNVQIICNVSPVLRKRNTPTIMINFAATFEFALTTVSSWGHT